MDIMDYIYIIADEIKWKIKLIRLQEKFCKTPITTRFKSKTN